VGRREIRLSLMAALLIGAATLYFGETGSCACAAQILGQPAPFNEFQAETSSGLVIIIASTVGLALSFLFPKKTNTLQSETS